MTGRTQGMLLALTGSVCLRLASSQEYLRYVRPWMRWPLLATAVVLLVVGLRLLWSDRVARTDHGPGTAWLMVLPIFAVFAISPPALGAFSADRTAVGVTADKDRGALGGSGVATMTISEFQGRAQWDETLTGVRVALTGFVAYADGGGWFVTRVAISCCAADAVSYRVRVVGATARPPENSWVRVTGVWHKPTGGATPRLDPPVMDVKDVVPVAAPANPYET
ncbi:MAG: hypothetical protein JWQ74_128 [Marmoricola sp.]|nr:hypothetical protein [Marmoricola sp.]